MQSVFLFEQDFKTLFFGGGGWKQNNSLLWKTSSLLFNLGRGAEQGEDTVLIVADNSLTAEFSSFPLALRVCNGHSFTGMGGAEIWYSWGVWCLIAHQHPAKAKWRNSIKNLVLTACGNISFQIQLRQWMRQVLLYWAAAWRVSSHDRRSQLGSAPAGWWERGLWQEMAVTAFGRWGYSLTVGENLKHSGILQETISDLSGELDLFLLKYWPFTLNWAKQYLELHVETNKLSESSA